MSSPKELFPLSYEGDSGAWENQKIFRDTFQPRDPNIFKIFNWTNSKNTFILIIKLETVYRHKMCRISG